MIREIDILATIASLRDNGRVAEPATLFRRGTPVEVTTISGRLRSEHH
jgi:hypothetical protein